ncbi:MAG: hypothetical protein Q7J57_08800, partial [Gemmobacter sp.]|nr:hypothetical protein [Gemmobacter sp.]
MQARRFRRPGAASTPAYRGTAYVVFEELGLSTYGILMDVPPGNSLPNPYSDNPAETGQPAFPWRGRITCSPAAGYAGTADKTATAATQVSALFGAATPANFSVSGQSVSWTGTPGDWGLRRMVLHYAHL